ncbi:hypothetical protein CUMW_082830 [Citrus unshiu]|nr:hypothetical protein CUMW_082830 [Citrus unshiu]
MKLVATDHSVQALEEYGTQYLTLDGFGHNKNEAFGSEDCSLSAASSSSSSSLRSSSSYVVVFVTISPSASISARLGTCLKDCVVR